MLVDINNSRSTGVTKNKSTGPNLRLRDVTHEINPVLKLKEKV